MTLIEPQAGTDESAWAEWAQPSRWPRFDLSVLTSRRVVMLVAHPDDEVLGVGGLLALLAARGVSPEIILATDGEASHPGSTSPMATVLAQVRRAESDAAARVLGLGAALFQHLRLPDGELVAYGDRLAEEIGEHVGPGDVVVTTWSGDGHPDHEACGGAARAACSDVLEFPLWAWHWSRPADVRVPWQRARRVDLPGDIRRAKAAGIACFRSQVEPIGPDQHDGPVLPPRVLQHFARDYEVLFA